MTSCDTPDFDKLRYAVEQTGMHRSSASQSAGNPFRHCAKFLDGGLPSL
ncbi:hypothetical protein [Streptomyces sp. NRRL S-1813]|nr:hypothetical protein [Streptomyces sp. NRRL S-1813]